MTVNALATFDQLSAELNLSSTNAIIKDYYGKMLSLITPNQSVIENHLNQKSILPVVLLLKSFSE